MIGLLLMVGLLCGFVLQLKRVSQAGQNDATV